MIWWVDDTDRGEDFKRAQMNLKHQTYGAGATVLWVIVLHMANLGSIYGTPYGSQTLLGVIP